MLTGVNRLKDLDGNTINQDDVHGEMYIKGPCMMNGYLDKSTAYAAAIDEDGWLRTGDIAYVNKGKVYIIDRAKVSPSFSNHSYSILTGHKGEKSHKTPS